MSMELWWALALSALGTFLMRVAPLVWMQRHLIRRAGTNAAMPVWLSVLGPTMIAAMFGVSLVPGQLSAAAWLVTACGSLVTWLVWLKTRSLGLPVLAGVLAYGLAHYLGLMIAGG